MKTKLGAKAYYWPTADNLAFAYDKPRLSRQPESLADDEDDLNEDYEEQKSGFSSGERQLKSLQEIAENTSAVVYLLDEWDANLDAKNRSQAENLVEKIASKALVIEISHRDRV
jgi:ABC-type transport system involved in cytochrome bd biosynthesis fused ATPase/permease subunit